jgi:membrane-associated protein
MQFLTDLFLNLDVVLQDWVAQYGAVIYALLFLIIFLETGLVVTPFLPGDSLLFAGGAVAAVSAGKLDVWLLYLVVPSAAVVGDFVNYWIGRAWGRRIIDSGRLDRVFKTKYIAKTRPSLSGTEGRPYRSPASSPSFAPSPPFWPASPGWS